jgi:hypothetical protein
MKPRIDSLKKTHNILIPPYGRKLVNLIVDDQGEKKKLIRQSKDLPRVKLSTLEFSDLIMLGVASSDEDLLIKPVKMDWTFYLIY